MVLLGLGLPALFASAQAGKFWTFTTNSCGPWKRSFSSAQLTKPTETRPKAGPWVNVSHLTMWEKLIQFISIRHRFRKSTIDAGFACGDRGEHPLM